MYLLLALVVCGSCLNLQLYKGEKCFLIDGRTSYDYSFIATTAETASISCSIFDGAALAGSHEAVKEGSGDFVLKTDQGRFCFSSTEYTIVSFDFIAKDDPAKFAVSDARLKETHVRLYGAFRKLSELYREQHFLRERVTLHRGLLFGLEQRLYLNTISKLFIVLFCCGLQFILLKYALDKWTHDPYAPLDQDFSESDPLRSEQAPPDSGPLQNPPF